MSLISRLPIKKLLLLSLLSSGTSLPGGFVLSEEAETTVASTALNISPRSCLKQSGICQKPLVVSWQFEKKTSFCLQLKNGLTLFCQKQTLAGSQQIDGRLKESTEFQFIRDNDRQLIKSVKVFVLSSNENRGQKRYRHPWSIF